MADVKTRAYYAPYDNDYYIPDAEGEKRVGKNENWRDIEKGFYLVQAKNDEQDGQFANIEAKDEEQDGRLDAIDAKDAEQDSRLDAIEAVNTQQNLDIQTNRTTITGLDTRLTSAESLLDAVSQTSVENSAAIAQLQTEQAALSGRMDTTNAQVADNSTRLTRAENNITSNTQELQLHGTQISDLEDQAVIRLQATFNRQAGIVTLTDPAAAYDALTSGHNAVIDLLVDNSYVSIYTKDINNSTNDTYRFTHVETGVDAGGNGYTGIDAITITLDTVNETISSIAWTQVYNVTKDYVDNAIANSVVNYIVRSVTNSITVPAKSFITTTHTFNIPAGHMYNMIVPFYRPNSGISGSIIVTDPMIITGSNVTTVTVKITFFNDSENVYSAQSGPYGIYVIDKRLVES